MTADILVDRTVVHAGAAADAAQRFLELACEDSAAPGIDQDKVHMLRAVELAFAFDAGENVDIIGNRLAGRRSRQEPHQGRDIFQRRDDFLDA